MIVRRKLSTECIDKVCRRNFSSQKSCYVGIKRHFDRLFNERPQAIKTALQPNKKRETYRYVLLCYKN